MSLLRPVTAPAVRVPTPPAAAQPPPARTSAAPSAAVGDSFAAPAPAKKRVLVVLPENGFDPTEASVPWKILKDEGHEVVFATASGARAPKADPLPFKGSLFSRPINATSEVKGFYRELSADSAFRDPIAFSEVDPDAFDAVVIPGGEGPGMIDFINDELLQQKVASFFEADKPVAAICHGVLVAARAEDPDTGKSVIADRRTAATPRFMEKLGSVGLALSGRPRVYDFFAEDEIRSVLNDPNQFVRGPLSFRRGTMESDRGTVVVEDGNYISGRWVGDAYAFGRALAAKLEQGDAP